MAPQSKHQNFKSDSSWKPKNSRMVKSMKLTCFLTFTLLDTVHSCRYKNSQHRRDTESLPGKGFWIFSHLRSASNFEFEWLLTKLIYRGRKFLDLKTYYYELVPTWEYLRDELFNVPRCIISSLVEFKLHILYVCLSSISITTIWNLNKIRPWSVHDLFDVSDNKTH